MQFAQSSGAATYTAGCNAHDVCYETCNSDKRKCDADLRGALRAECLRAYPRPAGAADDEKWDQRAVCLSRARAYANAVRDFGQPAFDAAQKLACECCPLPGSLSGTFTYHQKAGGPGTGVAFAELRGTGTVTFAPWPEQGPSAYKMAGTFNLTSFAVELGDCDCTGGGANGTLADQDNSLRFNTADQTIHFGWSASGSMPLTCTKRFPTANCVTDYPWSASWSLTTLSSGCTGSISSAYSTFTAVDGSWNQTCPIGGVVEDITWHFSGN